MISRDSSAAPAQQFSKAGSFPRPAERAGPGEVGRRVSSQEWSARVELAALYRLVAHFRWTDTIYTHISLRVPGEATFLLNPFGYLYEEVNASSLVKVDVDGNVVDDPTGFGINKAGFVIHGAIHAARPDVHCARDIPAAAPVRVPVRRFRPGRQRLPA